MGHEYYSFDRVLNELKMDEDELKRLVSEGQVPAFRDNNRMKFRRSDIEGLKTGRNTEPSMISPAPAADDADLQLVDDGTEETLLDLDGLDADDFQTDDSSVPSLDLDQTLDDGNNLTEELVFDDAEDLGGDLELDDDLASLGEDATQKIDDDSFLDDDDDFGMQTEPLTLGENDDFDLDDDDADATFVDDGDDTLIDDDDFNDVVAPGNKSRKPAPRPKKKARRAPARAAAKKPEPVAAGGPSGDPIGMLSMIGLVTVTLIFVLSGFTLAAYSLDMDTPLADFSGNLVAEQFLSQPTGLLEPGEYDVQEPMNESEINASLDDMEPSTDEPIGNDSTEESLGGD